MILATLLISLIGVWPEFIRPTYEYVPVINWQYKPIIKANLNGKPAFFLVDTGSDYTVLHSKTADRFNFEALLASRDQHQVLGFSGTPNTVYRAKDVNLVIGTTPVKALFQTYDLSGVVQSLYNRIHVKVAGIIGSDVMKRYGFIIDYQKQTIAIRTKNKK